MVFRVLVTAWRLAASPTSRSPVFEKATTEGVVRLPSEFSRTAGSPPSITAMQELVVPKSMPNTFAIWVLQITKIHVLISSGCTTERNAPLTSLYVVTYNKNKPLQAELREAN